MGFDKTRKNFQLFKKRCLFLLEKNFLNLHYFYPKMSKIFITKIGILKIIDYISLLLKRYKKV
jgi:hypothetical protein